MRDCTEAIVSSLKGKTRGFAPGRKRRRWTKKHVPCPPQSYRSNGILKWSRCTDVPLNDNDVCTWAFTRTRPKNVCKAPKVSRCDSQTARVVSVSVGQNDVLPKRLRCQSSNSNWPLMSEMNCLRSKFKFCLSSNYVFNMKFKKKNCKIRNYQAFFVCIAFRLNSTIHVQNMEPKKTIKTM